MEFFEKAHSKKSRNSENTKLQIKQMITAYKQNNIEGIRESADKNYVSEDSSLSLNSFPDLESNVAQISEKQENSDTSSVSCVEDLNLTNSTDNSFESDPSVKGNNSSINHAESGSEGSLSSSSADSSTRSSSSEIFDPKGTLAKNIHEKLMQSVSHAHYVHAHTNEPTEPVTKRKKRKIDNLAKQMNSWTIVDVSPSFPALSGTGINNINEEEDQSSEYSHDSCCSDCSNNLDSSHDMEDLDKEEQSSIGSSDHDMDHNDMDKTESCESFSYHSDSSYSDIAIPIEDDPSAPPFTSYVAPEFDDERLSDVFKGYNFIPIKGLPFQTQSDLPCSKFFTSDIEANDNERENNFEYPEEDTVYQQEETFDMSVNSQDISQEINSDIDNSEAIFDISIDNTIVEKIPDPDNVKVYKTRDTCILVLKHPCTLYIRGKLQVLSLGGTAEIFGYTLRNQYVDVFVPNHSVTFSLTTIQKEYNYYGMYSKLIDSGLSGMDAEDIVVGLGEYDVVLKMKELKFNSIEFVQKNFKLSSLFGYKPNSYLERCLNDACSFLNCSLSILQPPVRTFDECPTYRQIVEPKYDYRRSKVTPKGIVCGGKGSGKSTFVRYFVNQMLDGSTPVLVIDLDPGQAEFTPAGTVSATIVTTPLLGPNYTHLKKPERSFNVGAIDVFDNLNLYTEAVTKLIEHCKSNSQYKSMPWIVNTMGLCNSVGLNIITKVILSIEPTFVLQYDSKVPRNRFSIKLDNLGVKQYYESKSAQMRQDVYVDIHNTCRRLNYDHYVVLKYTERIELKSQYSLPAKEYRYLNYLAYFGQLLDQKRSKDLLSIIPYEVPVNKLKIRTNAAFDQDQLLQLLNGKIVALCEDNDSKTIRGICVLKKEPFVCHGYGIIRNIDMSKQLLYVLTPISVKTLELINTLAYSDWIPELRVEEDSFPGVAMPYRTKTPYNQKQLMFTPKRRFNPIQYFKLARKE